MINLQFQDQELKERFIKDLKKKLMPHYIETAKAEGYSDWQSEDRAQDMFSFFLMNTIK